jgi:hypothetical protein
LDWTIKSNLQNQFVISPQYTNGERVFFPLAPAGFASPLVTAGIPWPGIGISSMPGFGAGSSNGAASGGCWPCNFIADNLKWIKGKHSFTFGTELRWEDEKDSFTTNIGNYSFSNYTTSLPDAASPGSLGWGFASFFIGSPAGASRTGPIPSRNTHTGYRAAYAQDDIKLSSKLTVNLGVRWEFGIPAHDGGLNGYGYMSTFDPTVPNPGAGGLLGSLVYEGSTSGAPCISAGGAALCRRDIASTYYKQFDPRIGFAYRLNEKTVIRGGFGTTGVRGGASTLEGPAIADSFFQGFQPITNYVSPDSGFDSPSVLIPNWDTYFANGVPLQPAPPLTRASANGQAVAFMQTVDDRTGYMENWSLTVERKLAHQTVVEVSYVGSEGVRLGANLLNENQTPAHWMADIGSELDDDISCLANNTCPKSIAAGVKLPYAGFAGAVQQALRPFPQFLSIEANTQMDGHSNYNSLQARAQRYFSNGITFLVSFTWYKNLTNARSAFSPFYGPPLDVAHQGLEKGPVGAGAYGQEGPVVLSIAGVYDLPIGPGKKFVTTGGAVGKVIGGWSLSGILSYNAGDYLSVGGGTANPIFNETYGYGFVGGGGPRPNLLAGANPKAWTGGKFNPNSDFYLNSSAFSDAGAFSLGTAGPVLSNLRGWASDNENISVIKKTKLTEQLHMEWRFEFFNIFNRTQWCNSDANYNDVPSGNFGKVFCQANTPRQAQFAIRLEW